MANATKQYRIPAPVYSADKAIDRLARPRITGWWEIPAHQRRELRFDDPLNTLVMALYYRYRDGVTKLAAAQYRIPACTHFKGQTCYTAVNKKLNQNLLIIHIRRPFVETMPATVTIPRLHTYGDEIRRHECFQGS